jgi:hypothetical protein
MEGKPVNFENISNTIKSDVNDFKVKAKEWGKTTKSDIENWSKDIDTKQYKNSIGHVFGVLLKAFIIFTSVISALLLLSLSLSLSFTDFDSLRNFFFQGHFNQWLSNFVYLVLIITPILMIIKWLLQIIFKNRTTLKPLGWLINAMWLIAVIGGLYLTLITGRDAHMRMKTTEDKPLTFNSDSVTVRLGESNDDHVVYNFGVSQNLFKIDHNRLYINAINNVRIGKSPDDQWHLMINKEANGRNKPTALQRAEKINCNYRIENNQLFIDPYIYIEHPQIYRFQWIKLTLLVPEGKKATFKNNNHQYYYYNDNNVADWDQEIPVQDTID